ncbi:DUF4738 domain-containing protein [Spirosoma flavum]|uniref:DUF4738 domain-containing protein n=1 Tax=Spirosoma flavum TaxID=2048557 RepID=A0ABW6ALZ9_9BACT
MKNTRLLLLVVGLLSACGHTENAKENATRPTNSLADSVAAPAPKPQNCQSIVAADKLGKSNVFHESAKPINVTLILDQDTSTTQAANGCYFDNMITVLATKKSGSRVFKRTLLKDDLLYFSKKDEAIEQAILQNVTYKPTFNGQKYITLSMRLINPGSRKTTDYTVFMNYFGEIVKVK